MMDNILTNIIFLPLFMAVMLGIFRAPLKVLKMGALFSSIVTLLLVAWLTYHFDPHSGMQFVQDHPSVSYTHLTLPTICSV